MSRNSIKYNLNHRKYNLKFFIYTFILFDLFLYFNINPRLLAIIIGWEFMLFFGVIIGHRGQGKYRELVMELIEIRNDPELNDKEDLRGHRLKRHIDEACIQYNIWFERQANRKDKKVIKIKKGGKRIMNTDEPVMKQLGYTLVSILALWGLMLGFVLDLFEIHFILILFISGTWEILDGFLFFYIHYIFNIEPKKEIVI